MATEHYIVFIGAGAPLADELLKLEGRISKSRVIAPAAKKADVGLTEAAVESASARLHEELSMEADSSEVARLYLWMFDPDSASEFERVWRAFGHASWVETISRRLSHNKVGTRERLERRTNEIQGLLHNVSGFTYGQRKTAPLSLPLRNFTSEITKELKTYWYNDLNQEQLLERMRRLKGRYSQVKVAAERAYRDKKGLVFKPAEDTELHGRSHPSGSLPRTFFCGRFRFGVSLFPGFHFDVTPEKSSTIQCALMTPSGGRRLARDRTHVNIFPNDQILPEK